MPLQAGQIDSLGNFIEADCMAKFMEDAMVPPADPEDTGKKGRRQFLIAISTGIIEYLKTHDQDSFRITFQQNNTTMEGRLEIL